jgi:hypothetical protein
MRTKLSICIKKRRFATELEAGVVARSAEFLLQARRR